MNESARAGLALLRSRLPQAMPRFGEHLARLGPTWSHFTFLPILFYSGFIFFWRGELRWEMFALFIVPPFFAFISPRTRRLYTGLYPMLWTAVLYDAMRFVRNVGVSVERVHVCDLRRVELALFGVTSGGTKMTLQDYFLSHSSPMADIYFAIPYGTFLYVSVLFAAFLYFKDQSAFRRYGWGFLVMNAAAYLTYHLYPAAPPWYYHAHGCAVDLTVSASEGPHLAYVDAVLGFKYFGSFYGRAAEVFGAIPSLHVAYPLLILIEGWRSLRPWGRGLGMLFSISMIFAAVYLDHHWVIDVLVGLLYGTSVPLLLRVVFRRSSARSADAEPMLDDFIAQP
jgi:inositol phosphorylceramide synthase catalytic subunit